MKNFEEDDRKTQRKKTIEDNKILNKKENFEEFRAKQKIKHQFKQKLNEIEDEELLEEWSEYGYKP
jgi:hypothetical protein